MSKTSLKLT